MTTWHISKKLFVIIILAGLLSMGLLVSTVAAGPDPKPAFQETGTPTPITDQPPPTETPPPKPCTDCHPDKHDAWLESPHAHSFDDPVFQEGWANMELAGECLLCHKAEYDPATDNYIAEGVSCEACHGPSSTEHPPAEVPVLSDEEYCGTCHPTTLGEARLSGHSTSNDVRCVDCHDPHSQKVLFENPDDMCKDCHDMEDLSKMDEALSNLHLQENIPCADCHTLDVPHTFLFNFQHEDTAPFFKGFDCTSEITASVVSRVGTSHEVLGSYVEDQMSWPVVHRVSRLETAPQCSDCHVMDDKLRTDFMALGYSPEEVDKLSWENEDFPALTDAEINKLVAKPKRSWSWVYWLVGVAAVFGVFELTVARKLEAGPKSGKEASLFSIFRKKSTKKSQKNEDDSQGKA
jgi:hypothetical protein